MRIAEVIGTVTLSRWHPSLTGSRWSLVVPLDAQGLRGDAAGRGEPIVAYDDLGAGIGGRIAIADGAEAAAPFQPDTKPVDAYNAAILDRIEIT
ncbi:MAG: EutN/CcmL family microcompartment protein [Planctomycetaceae bacterium]